MGLVGLGPKKLHVLVGNWVGLGSFRCYYFTLLCTPEKSQIEVNNHTLSAKNGLWSQCQVDCHWPKLDELQRL